MYGSATESYKWNFHCITIPPFSLLLAEHEATQASWHPQGPASPDIWAAGWCWCHQSDVCNLQLILTFWLIWAFIQYLHKHNIFLLLSMQSQWRVRWWEPLSEQHAARVCWSDEAVAWGWEWQGLWHPEGHSLSLQCTCGQYHSECSRYIS